MNSNQRFVLILIVIGCFYAFIPNSKSEIPALIIGGALTHLRGQKDESRNTDTIE